MGEARKEALRVGFDSQMKREFCGANVTSLAPRRTSRIRPEDRKASKMG